MPPEIVTITCPATGDRARVLVNQGFNCFEYIANIAGQKVDVLWSLPNYASGTERASSSGIPLLFPFPGRVPGSKFVWNGKTYDLEPGDQYGNAIHGFCHTRAWRVIARQDDTVVGEFHASKDDPSILEHWPSDFRIRATYELGAGILACTYKFDNPGDRPLPCGFGAHPYFRIPLGGSSAADCTIRLPVTKHWEAVDMLPTGEVTNVSDATPYAGGMRFGDLTLDDVFTGLTFAGERSTASITDPQSRRTVSILWDKTYRELVVYTPPHREAICIEPYTCVPAAAALQSRGIDSGWRVLAPGESFSGRIEIRVH